MNLPLYLLDRALCDIERSVALLSRCQPVNLLSEMVSVREAWQRGCPRAPRFCYGTRPDLTWARRWLDELLEQPCLQHDWGRLYAERAQELMQEAFLAERIGSRDFAELAGRRYPRDAGPDGAAADRSSGGQSTPEPPQK